MRHARSLKLKMDELRDKLRGHLEDTEHAAAVKPEVVALSRELASLEALVSGNAGAAPQVGSSCRRSCCGTRMSLGRRSCCSAASADELESRVGTRRGNRMSYLGKPSQHRASLYRVTEAERSHAVEVPLAEADEHEGAPTAEVRQPSPPRARRSVKKSSIGGYLPSMRRSSAERSAALAEI